VSKAPKAAPTPSPEADEADHEETA
jgi:hypothetical protein